MGPEVVFEAKLVKWSNFQVIILVEHKRNTTYFKWNDIKKINIFISSIIIGEKWNFKRNNVILI